MKKEDKEALIAALGFLLLWLMRNGLPLLLPIPGGGGTKKPDEPQNPPGGGGAEEPYITPEPGNEPIPTTPTPGTPTYTPSPTPTPTPTPTDEPTPTPVYTNPYDLPPVSNPLVLPEPDYEAPPATLINPALPYYTLVNSPVSATPDIIDTAWEEAADVVNVGVGSAAVGLAGAAGAGAAAVSPTLAAILTGAAFGAGTVGATSKGKAGTGVGSGGGIGATGTQTPPWLFKRGINLPGSDIWI